MPTVAPAGHDYENHASLFCGADVRDFKEDMPAANFALAFEGLKWTDPDVFTLMLCQSLLGTYDKKSSNMQYATAPMVLALDKYKVRARGAEAGRDWPRWCSPSTSASLGRTLSTSLTEHAPLRPPKHTHTHAPRCARAASPVCRPTPCSSLPQVAEQVQPFCTCYNDTGLFGVYVTANLDSYDDYSTLFQILQAPPASHRTRPTHLRARTPSAAGLLPICRREVAGGRQPPARGALTLPLPHPASA